VSLSCLPGNLSLPLSEGSITQDSCSTPTSGIERGTSSGKTHLYTHDATITAFGTAARVHTQRSSTSDTINTTGFLSNTISIQHTYYPTTSPNPDSIANTINTRVSRLYIIHIHNNHPRLRSPTLTNPQHTNNRLYHPPHLRRNRLLQRLSQRSSIYSRIN
jgi:hypothetical protein